MKQAKIRLSALLSALCLALCLWLPARAANVPPYELRVNRAANTVTVYTADAAGEYTVPLRAMVCSTGRAGEETPLGSFALTALRHEWCHMLDGSWGQYSTQFSGHYLFHSVCYSAPDPAALLTEEYNLLGAPASLGCVRLQVADAKWIYENCAPGTRVVIYDDAGDPGPLGAGEKLLAEIPAEEANGWEPSDPRPDNPWLGRYVETLSVGEASLTLTAGEAQRLTVRLTPENALVPGLRWFSDAPAVAAVDESGTVTALGAGRAVITAKCGALSESCAVTVRGALLPFADVPPGAWYYPALRQAWEGGLMRGTGGGTFSPEEAVSRAMAIQVLYNLAKAEPPEHSGGEWYSAALAWAAENGLSTGMSARGLLRPITRQEFAALLYRYETLARGREPAPAASLEERFSDAGEVYAFAEQALAWAVEAGLLQGTADGILAPAAPLTRAETAEILLRYSRMGE